MSPKQPVTHKDASNEQVRSHQPGQDVFKSILPEAIDWKPFAAFPPEVRLAVVVGDPSQKGPYTIRVKVPHGVELMPHQHPEDRVYTVISGASERWRRFQWNGSDTLTEKAGPSRLKSSSAD